MLRNKLVALQLVASRVALSSVELVIIIIIVLFVITIIYHTFCFISFLGQLLYDELSTIPTMLIRLFPYLLNDVNTSSVVVKLHPAIAI
jgi:hypothetical protein